MNITAFYVSVRKFFSALLTKKKARGLAGGRAGLWAGVRAGIYDAQARVSGQASALDKAVAFWQ